MVIPATSAGGQYPLLLGTLGGEEGQIDGWLLAEAWLSRPSHPPGPEARPWHLAGASGHHRDGAPGYVLDGTSLRVLVESLLVGVRLAWLTCFTT